MFVFHFEKSVTVFGFLRLSSFSFVFTAAGIEDTHLTLAVVPLKVEINNSLISVETIIPCTA